MPTHEFMPPWWLRHRHVQTILGTFGLGASGAPTSSRVIVRLDDGDALSLETSFRVDAKATVVLIHGLGGSHESTYMCRVASKLDTQGFNTVRVNMRGAGSGMGLARGFAHSGRSEDVISVLRYLAGERQGQPVFVVGFSLGGNQMLKAVGELGPEAKGLVDAALAVCPPIDLHACVEHMAAQARGVYERYLLDKLKETLRGYQQHFAEYRTLAFEGIRTLYDFDDRVTAPLSGYDNAANYYARCSSAALIKNACVPTQILYAQDDPFIDARIFSKVDLGQVQTIAVPFGGHMGFLGLKPWRWMDAFILRWAVDSLAAIGADKGQ